MTDSSLIQELIDTIVKKYDLGRKSVVVQNRHTHEVKTIKINPIKLVRLAVYGWFWSYELDGWLVCFNENYYEQSMDKKECYIVDETQQEFFKALYETTNFRNNSFPMEPLVDV